MCGIAGIFRTKLAESSSEREALGCMLDAMRSRGPDSQGIYQGQSLTMGMVRLSIIDVQDGDQPIFNEDGSVAVVLNGEIYNYIELRSELLDSGHRFSTQSDTEVLVHGFEQWGIEGLSKRLRGMFAFAIHDARNDELYLVRDRFGIKPLFSHESPLGFFFASDLKSLTAHPDVPRRLSGETLWNFLSVGYPPGPDTFFDGISQVAPGTWTRIVLGRAGPSGRYWSMTFPRAESVDDRTEDEVLQGLDLRLQESVLLHQRSDVPYGAFLSGGLDSATVVSIMAAQSTRRFQTFSVGFQEDGFDESPFAEAISRHLGVPNTRLILDVPSVEECRDVLRIWDQPHFDFSCIPTLAVSRLARRDVKVVLTGDGGDELLAGYPTHFLHKIVPAYESIPSFVRKGLIEPISEALPARFGKLSWDAKLKSFVRGARGGFERAHYRWRLLFDESEKQRLVSRQLVRPGSRPDSYFAFERHFAEVDGCDRLNQLLFVDAKTFLVDDTLYKVDRMSMAVGLEARVPFLDDRLWDFMAGVPARLKQPGFKTKWLLRRLMRERLPAGIANLPKGGFVPPVNRWLRGPLYALLEQDLLGSRHLDRFFDRALVTHWMREHREGRVDHARRLWCLLAFQSWHDRTWG